MTCYMCKKTFSIPSRYSKGSIEVHPGDVFDLVSVHDGLKPNQRLYELSNKVLGQVTLTDSELTKLFSKC